jgi:hypothetical protein
MSERVETVPAKTDSHQQLRPDFIRSKRQKRSRPEYQLQNRYSGISFFDQDARPGHHVFQIGVGPSAVAYPTHWPFLPYDAVAVLKAYARKLTNSALIRSA